MSDSGDDLGGFAPVTPHLPQKRIAKARTNDKANSRTIAEPGPSKPAGKAIARKRATNTRNKVSPANDDDDDDTDVQEVNQELDEVDAEMVSAEDEDVRMVNVPKGRKGAASSGTVGSNANGKAAAKGKGKGKGKAKVPVAKAKKVSLETDAIDVDAEEEDEEIEDEMNNAAQETFRLAKKDKELTKLQEKLHRFQEHIQSLTEKLEEAHQIRETEAIKVLKALNEQFQEEVKSKEALVEALTTQLAQKQTLALDSILHMITREAADEEQRKLASDINQYREALKEKERELKEKVNQIADSRQIENELRFELKTEIERSKALSDKSLRTPQASRSRVAGAAFEDPKNAEVIRFYEDLTNLLVTSMKHQASHKQGADEWTLKCIYTYSDDDGSTDPLQQKSVAFTLRTTFPSKNDPDSNPNEQSIQYSPDDLDKEPSDFVDKLGFFNQPFTFSRKQLSLFLRMLYDNLREALAVESMQEDDEIQIIEK